jgi:hypothetical protein
MTELMRYAKWNGTAEEWRELQIVTARHCTCLTTQLCATHEMVVKDQRAVNGLVFARRIVERLLVEEFRPAGHHSAARNRAQTAASAMKPVRLGRPVKLPQPGVDNPLAMGGGSTTP